MQLKRLWDTDNKRMVFAEGPTGHQCQVWTDETGDHLYIYDMAQWLTYDGEDPAAKEYVRSNWKELTDEEVGFYDSNEPTELYGWEDGDEASYKFVNYDGTVLDSGTVEEGQTPVYAGDTPTKPSTETADYTFSGWEPALGPITKRTTFVAQFTSTPIPDYLVTIDSQNHYRGDVDVTTITARRGTAVSTLNNTLTVGNTVVTATPDEGFAFSRWTAEVGGETVSIPATITENITFIPNFDYGITIAFESNEEHGGDFDKEDLCVLSGSAVSVNGNVLTIGYQSVTATAAEDYVFIGWMGEYNELTQEYDPLPATATQPAIFHAMFAEAGPVTVGFASSDEHKGDVDVESVNTQTGAQIIVDGNQITIGSTTVTATAEEDYTFIEWKAMDTNSQEISPFPQYITSNIDYFRAVFDSPL